MRMRSSTQLLASQGWTHHCTPTCVFAMCVFDLSSSPCFLAATCTRTAWASCTSVSAWPACASLRPRASASRSHPTSCWSRIRVHSRDTGQSRSTADVRKCAFSSCASVVCRVAASSRNSACANGAAWRSRSDNFTATAMSATGTDRLAQRVQSRLRPASVNKRSLATAHCLNCSLKSFECNHVLSSLNILSANGFEAKTLTLCRL